MVEIATVPLMPKIVMCSHKVRLDTSNWHRHVHCTCTVPLRPLTRVSSMIYEGQHSDLCSTRYHQEIYALPLSRHSRPSDIAAKLHLSKASCISVCVLLPACAVRHQHGSTALRFDERLTLWPAFSSTLISKGAGLSARVCCISAIVWRARMNQGRPCTAGL